jgi:DNA-binding IclR family transcriptional regulator
MLRLLFDAPDLTVSGVATQLHIPVMVACQYLRALNARGLIAARRHGRWVQYRAAADPSVRGSAALLQALKRTFSAEQDPVEVVFRLATAFTHFRRVQVVHALAAGPMSSAALKRTTRISRPALARHLAKLVARGFVVHEGGAYRLERPRCRLAAVLLSLAGSHFAKCEHGKG